MAQNEIVYLGLQSVGSGGVQGDFPGEQVDAWNCVRLSKKPKNILVNIINDLILVECCV